METVLTLVNLICGLFCFMSNLYMHLSYSDMSHGAIGSIEVTKSMNTYLPYEIGVHFIVTLCGILHQDYFLFLFTVPVTLFHLLQVIKDEFYFDPLTVLHYHIKKKNEMIIKLKGLYYSVLIIWQFYNFSMAFSSAMVYRVFYK